MPSATWHPVHSLLLDGDGVVRRLSAAFSTQALQDAVLEDDCVYALAPGYVWRREAADTVAALTAELVDAAGRVAPGPRAAVVHRVDKVVTLRWCDAALADAASVNVTLRVGTSVVARTVVSRPPQSTRGPLAACTMFHRPASFALWARYLLAVGVDVVYGYYYSGGGNLSGAPFESLAPLLADGSVVVLDWPADYYFFNPPDVSNFISQGGAMMSCQLRHRRSHEWTIFMDDDEFPYVVGPRRLGDFFADASRRGLAGVMFALTWATAGGPLGPNTTLPELAALPWRAGPPRGFALRDRTKFAVAATGAPSYGVHTHGSCGTGVCPRHECCAPPAAAGFLHFTDAFGAHVGSAGGAWGDTHDWTPTPAIAVMLRKGRGALGARVGPLAVQGPIGSIP